MTDLDASAMGTDGDPELMEEFIAARDVASRVLRRVSPTKRAVLALLHLGVPQRATGVILWSANQLKIRVNKRRRLRSELRGAAPEDLHQRLEQNVQKIRERTLAELRTRAVELMSVAPESDEVRVVLLWVDRLLEQAMLEGQDLAPPYLIGKGGFHPGAT